VSNLRFVYATVLPMGYTNSPYVVAKVMGGIVRKCREEGIVLTTYAEDWLVLNPTDEHPEGCSTLLALQASESDSQSWRASVSGAPAMALLLTSRRRHVVWGRGARKGHATTPVATLLLLLQQAGHSDSAGVTANITYAHGLVCPHGVSSCSWGQRTAPDMSARRCS
jgi:hypothetical protein